MKFQIHLRRYILLCIVAVATVSCKKTTDTPLLAPGAIYISEAVNTDTAKTIKMSTDKDSLFTIKLEAAVKAATSGTHNIVLGVDTSKMAAYRSKYGNATALPSSSYFIPFASCQIPAGATKSNSAEINILSQSTLRPLTTYVLPVVIKNVDGQTPETIGQGQVIYLVLKTIGIDYGTPINKASWSIVAYSATYSAALYPATAAIDSKPGTQWVTPLTTPMPQYITIDMAQTYNLKAVTYQEWSSFSAGANPSQIKIELSTDGSNWLNMGTFTDTAPSTAVKNLPMKPVTPARYIRFTVLQASIYASIYTPVAIAEIGANN
jgi:F5/8 type C domain/Domain of unknown function (DUF1735)